MFLVLKQQNKTRLKKKNFSTVIFVCFYPSVPNFNDNKHIKPIVNRSTVIGTLNIHFKTDHCSV